VGNTFIPGHAIESMWFMERIYRHWGDEDRIALAMQAIEWHLEKGWDPEYGGIYHACHAKGGTPASPAADAKLWWPLTEAIYAVLVAWHVTGAEWCARWHERIHEYTFRVFPNREHGDWFQALDRKNNPIPPVIASLPVKDPFHLPRALIYSSVLIEENASC
jgi:N-acylglucosamine 2-epimerase